MTAYPDDILIEDILDQLFIAISGAGAVDTDTVVTRNNATLVRFEGTNAAIVNLIDGSPQLIGSLLGGGGEEYLHTARAEIIVRGEDGADRDKRFAELRRDVHRLIVESGRLNGLCDWVAAQPMEEPDNEIAAFADGVKIGVLPIQITYTAPSEAG